MPKRDQWFNADDKRCNATTSFIKSWLPGPPCLTRAFKQFYGHIKIQVLGEKIKKIPPTIKSLIKIDDDTGLIRQVYLLGDNHPLCYSQTIVPLTTLQSNEAFLHLGENALGETLLFNRPNINRSEFQIACLLPTTRLYQQSLKYYPNISPDQLWARRSIFQIKSKPLLVTEVFLPQSESTLTKLSPSMTSFVIDSL